MNQRSALEMILAQPRHGGLSKSAIILHQKQCEDFEKMQKEINLIKTDLQEVKANQSLMHQKIDNILALFYKRISLSGNLKEIMNNKVFLYLLITLMCALFGASVGEVGLKILK